jgi:hypothetical protein
LRIGEAAPFVSTPFCPTSTTSSSALFWRGPLRSAVSAFFPDQFCSGEPYGMVRLGRPGLEEKDMSLFSPWPRTRDESPHPRLGATAAP